MENYCYIIPFTPSYLDNMFDTSLAISPACFYLKVNGYTVRIANRADPDQSQSRLIWVYTLHHLLLHDSIQLYEQFWYLSHITFIQL